MTKVAFLMSMGNWSLCPSQGQESPCWSRLTPACQTCPAAGSDNTKLFQSSTCWGSVSLNIKLKDLRGGHDYIMFIRVSCQGGVVWLDAQLKVIVQTIIR